MGSPPGGRGVGGSRFYYLPDYIPPPHNISLGITDAHIISDVKRERKPPARFIPGERDIPPLDEWKSRKKARKSTTPDEHKIKQNISVIIPPPNLGNDSDDSPLTEVEDLLGDIDDLASNATDDVEVAPATFPEDPKLCNADGNGRRQLTQQDGRAGCPGEMINLHHKAQQTSPCRSHETVSQQKEIETLQRENNRLRAQLANIRASQCTSTNDPLITISSADGLLSRNNEIQRLRRRLSNALELIELARPLPSYDDAFATSTGFIYQEMDTLGNYVVYTANSLFKIQRHDIVDETIDQNLTHLIEQTIISKALLSTEPISAFRALTFGFIQERVFHAPEIWRELHFDGIMFRQFQSILEESISPETLEKYHRATVNLTLSRNPEFKEAFVSKYADQIQFEFFKMMAPLLKSGDMGAHFKRQTRTLFRHALTLRACCYPHIGTRYQLVHFKPGHIYDPQTMRAEDEAGATVHVPEDGRQRRIKLCVHGLMKAYSIQENTTGLDLIKELSQPFLVEGGKHGHIISDRAAVILDL
ncbi:hypothetical protein ANOM_006653 [Aspergillus nomiae NRRL 13137]|uniref:Uncharacterized protein n=1 Tax=Aspergillus nomiae NRRL (strain ATCC 15546 / NRRL 13137 / CBS 260.88 / M93) TaxID=1509407 RepID=A0A0L1J1D7_ASPN3|nr:uncharacterized protein ANOM_006653 [Aspergillus nomiae NRRL 13137]KNG85564.1 hypothetical protein ANOM_006653 [Aspergillus nomiae NRRL 13137]